MQLRAVESHSTGIVFAAPAIVSSYSKLFSALDVFVVVMFVFVVDSVVGMPCAAVFVAIVVVERCGGVISADVFSRCSVSFCAFVVWYCEVVRCSVPCVADVFSCFGSCVVVEVTCGYVAALWELRANSGGCTALFV